MIRERLTDQDLLNALRTDSPGRAYTVLVTGRMGEHAYYRVTAANADLARRIGREYANRIDRDTFRFSTYPRVAMVARAN